MLHTAFDIHIMLQERPLGQYMHDKCNIEHLQTPPASLSHLSLLGIVEVLCKAFRCRRAGDEPSCHAFQLQSSLDAALAAILHFCLDQCGGQMNMPLLEYVPP